MVSRNIQRKSS